MHIEEPKISIQQLMSESGVSFGTSGARGLVTAMSDWVCYAYTLGFLQHLDKFGSIGTGTSVSLAGDLRASSPRIMAAVAKAVTDFGLLPINTGPLPTPAVTLYGIRQGIPSIMVTGSHIPDDRNGIKFNSPRGEILKQDESSILQQQIIIPDNMFDHDGNFINQAMLPDENQEAHSYYLKRYLQFFPVDCLHGMRICVYEHTSVARDIINEVLTKLGAQVISLGRSDVFVPVDTEAIRPEDIELGKEWATKYQLNAIVSTDGDADRPLISDENGNWLRGDIAGILCARYLGIKNLSTPVSSNTAVEKCGWFDQIARTRIGSPYVIESMQQMISAGTRSVAGYEANGGFLISDQIKLNKTPLDPLPTRDALIVIISILLLSKEQQMPISKLLELLPNRFTASNRLKNFPTSASRDLLEQLSPGSGNDFSMIENMFASEFGLVKAINPTDGLRIIFKNEEIVHLRPSGNAPELRCYNEADSEARATEMNLTCLKILNAIR